MLSQSYEPNITYTFFGKEIFCKKVKKKFIEVFHNKIF